MLPRLGRTQMASWGKGIKAEFWGKHSRCLVKAEGVAQKEAHGLLWKPAAMSWPLEKQPFWGRVIILKAYGFYGMFWEHNFP